MSRPSLIVEDLSVRVGAFRLEVPRLEVAPGTLVGIDGRSGSGKSTLLLAVAGFLPLETGRIQLGERDLTPLCPEARKVALIFQRGALFPHLNVFQNIEYGLKLQGIPQAERSDRVHRWLEALEIEELSNRRSHQLSGGQAQRVALARAFIVNFPVLLMDEPFTGLDAELKSQLRSVVKGLVAQEKTCALIVSHDPEDLRELTTARYAIDQGRLALQGPL